MRRIVNVQETEVDGLEALMGEHVALWCDCYIYAGVLTGVNETCVALKEAKVVYETGKLSEAGFKDAQALPGEEWFIQIAKIESFGVMQ